MKLIIYLTLCAILLQVYLLPLGQAQRVLAKEAPKLIYTNEKNYSYRLKSDATQIDYKHFFRDDLIRESTKKLENPELKPTDSFISLDLTKEGEHRIEFSLLDDVWNRSKLYKSTIISDRTKSKLEILSTELCEDHICARISLSEDAVVNNISNGKRDSLARGEHDLRISKDKWQENKEYSFELQAEDRSGNRSDIKRTSIITPELTPGTGSVFGANDAQPWGRDNKYEKIRATAILHWDNSTLQDKY
ncbi:MAG: hypothetical protein ACOCXP_03490, partial [Candidatus Dojkabacteria bacterium]